MKAGCNSTHTAKGDGKTDDTAAIQACFDMLSSPTGTPVGGTVFLPAGQYVVTSTLKLFKVLGGTVIGTGETTVLIWRGKKGGNSTVIWSDGITRSRMIGFVLDGREGADFGVDHWSNHSLFGESSQPAGLPRCRRGSSDARTLRVRRDPAAAHQPEVSWV